MIEKSEIQSKVSSYLSNTDKISVSVGKVIDFIFTTPLETLAYSPDQLPDSSLYSVSKNRSDYVKIALSLDFQSAFPYDTLSESMDPKTKNAIAELVHSIEIKPSKKLLVDLMKQKSIQDVIANIIESGIVEFNKKTNPLYGMIQATGLDKQIKSFINLFLPNFLPQIAEFLYNTSLGDNSTLSKDIAFLVMNAPIAELKLPSDLQIISAEEKLKVLREQISVDVKLQNTIHRFVSTLQKRFLDKYGKDTLMSFLKLPTEEYDSFKKTMSVYIAHEIKVYNSKNDLSNVVSDLIEDILMS